MAVYKRGGTYWFEFVFDGHRVRESAKTKNKRVAEQIESARKTQLAKREVGLDVERPKVPNFPEAMRQFLAHSGTEHASKPATTLRYITSSKPLLRFFGSLRIDEIGPAEVEKYKKWRVVQRKKPPAKKFKKEKGATTVKPISSATVNRELACLKAMLNLFVKADMLARNPVSKVKFLPEHNESFVVLSRDEEVRYLLAASQPLQDVATIMLETGCRPEEIYRLKLENVDLGHNCLRIESGKTKSARRMIPLTERVKRVLQRRVEGASDGDYLFAGRRSPNRGEGSPVLKLNNAHSGAIGRSGVRKFRLYDLRHTFASRMAMAGVDLVTLAALLGHSRVQMVLRYAHPVEEHKVEAISRLEHFNANARKAA